MPVVRLRDATFVDLKLISTWLGTNTPSETIDALVRDKMTMLDLERDIEEHAAVQEEKDNDLFFSEAPGLSFTRILSASINGKKLAKTNWSGLLLHVISRLKAQGITGEKLVHALQVPAKGCAYSDEGYKFYPELGISVQGQSASDAWKEISRIADK